MLSPSHPHDFHAGFQTVCTTSPLASRTGARSFKGVNVVQSLCRFAAALQQLLAARDSAAFERVWDALGLDRLAWDALALARRADTDAVEPALAQVDRLLLAVLDRCRAFLDRHLVTFRVPELERWQHAAAAALVGARWGVAGLRTVIADTPAPLGRRYFAFLGIAERHPDAAWPLFERYLVTPAHTTPSWPRRSKRRATTADARTC